MVDAERMGRARFKTLGLIAIVLLAAAVVLPAIRARVRKVLRPKQEVAARVDELGPAARARLRAGFGRAGVEYPPRRVTLVAFKRERRMEVYAAGAVGVERRVLEYPILAASGHAGPKLREGDMQVPEGVYAVESLNPNSMYHVALRVGYPSEEDRARAASDGRTRLGGDIMIHGGAASVGCLAMGDSAAAELFVLAADVGIEWVEVVLCPADFRVDSDVTVTEPMPAWVRDRYEGLRRRLEKLGK